MASTLADMARRIAINNVAGILDVGDLPFPVVSTILKSVASPQQLRTIEDNSPQIRGETGELWRVFIARDIAGWQQKMQEPKNPSNWWRVYRLLKKQDDEAQQAAEDTLRAALGKKQAEKAAKTSTFVNQVIQEKMHDLDPSLRKIISRGGRVQSGRFSTSTGSSVHKPTSAQALKKAGTSREKFAILRRQAASSHSHQANVHKAVPTHQLHQQRSTVREAPATMTRQYATKSAAAPAIKPPRSGATFPAIPIASRWPASTRAEQREWHDHLDFQHSATFDKVSNDEKARIPNASRPILNTKPRTVMPSLFSSSVATPKSNTMPSRYPSTAATPKLSTTHSPPRLKVSLPEYSRRSSTTSPPLKPSVISGHAARKPTPPASPSLAQSAALSAALSPVPSPAPNSAPSSAPSPVPQRKRRPPPSIFHSIHTSGNKRQKR